jgi:hypothetical protein
MSFHLAHPSNDTTRQTVSLAVRDKGLSLLRAKPCEVSVTVIPSLVQPGYACYTKNLPAFMEATMTNKSTIICNRGYPLTTVKNQLPWRVPSLIYDFDKNPSDGKVEQLKQHSQIIGGRGKNKTFVMTEPTIANIRDLVKIGANRKTSHVMGTVNIDAMKMVHVIKKILSAFICTHVYPALRHPTDKKPMGSRVESVTKKRKLTEDTFEAKIADVHKDDDDVAMMTNEDNEKKDPSLKEVNIELSRAKPTLSIDRMWGPVDTIPNASGLYVPFVKELAVGDSVTLPTVISSYFVRSLSSDLQGMCHQLNELKAAWGVISSTTLGHEITHLAKCIDIALQAQATIYPVYTNDVYEGCVISGSGYSISIRDEIMQPIAYDKLQKLVQDNSAHSRALRQINERVGALVEIDTIRTMRELSHVVQEQELDESSKTDIVKAAHQLCFENKYWSTSPMNVKRMLDLLRNDEDIGVDVPLHPKYLFATDRVEMILSAFGHQAPTFMLANGPKYQLGKDDPPKNFNVRTTTVESAILDMKYMIENGYMTNNTQNLSNKHRDTPLKGSDKVEVWRFIKEIYASSNNSKVSGSMTKLVRSKGKSVDDDLF